MIFRHRDGEMRVYDNTSGGTGPYYIELLFVNADLSFPIARHKTEEILHTDRGNVDSNSAYAQGLEDALLEGIPFSVTAKLTDENYTGYLTDWLSGVTVINDKTLTTCKASSSVTIGQSAVSTPSFADGTKMAYNVEVLWDGTNDYGWKLAEVYFPPDQQTINEGEDAVTVNINGLIYGQISKITSFSSGTTIES